MKPFVGAVVVVRTPQQQHNGTNIHPGIITRIWNDVDPAAVSGTFACVNVKVLPDCGQPFDQTSMYFFDEAPDVERFPYAAWWARK